MFYFAFYLKVLAVQDSWRNSKEELRLQELLLCVTLAIWDLLQQCHVPGHSAQA